MTPATDSMIKQDIVYALARSAETLYAARASGLYRSQDDGKSWQNAFTSLEPSEPMLVTALAIHDSTIFAGGKGAVLWSDDRGDTWHLCGLASPPPLVTALSLSPNFTQDGFIVAATAEDGVFISTDRGQSWMGWNFGLVDMNVYALAVSPNFEHDDVVFSGTESGLFRSHDGGRAWEEVDFPMDAGPVLSLTMSPQFASDGLMYAGTESSGLFRSNDSGVSWQMVTADIADGAINSLQFDAALNLWLLLDSALLMTIDGEHFTQPYAEHFPPDSLATALLSPISAHAPLVGFAEGDILKLSAS